MNGWPARVSAVAADAVSTAMADVVHLSGCDGSRFRGDDRFWPISAAAAAALDSTGRSTFHISQNTNTLSA